jgi:hypothetical protein
VADKNKEAVKALMDYLQGRAEESRKSYRVYRDVETKVEADIEEEVVRYLGKILAMKTTHYHDTF